MSSVALFLTLSAALAGAFVVAVGLAQSRRPAVDLGDYLQEIDGDDLPVDDFQRRLAEPFLVRVARPLGESVLQRIAGLTPRHYLETTHHKLLLAGMTSRMRAEEFVTAQAVVTAVFTLGAIAYVILGRPSPRIGILMMVLLPALGWLAPASWLSRKVDERKQSIRKDLPDTLDLLAISVEAGMGFEGALDIVCRHFRSPLAEEFARTLQEMELGLPRRDAFQNLKRRTEVPELSNFVLALLQADALGIPIGRVLRTQATEMRAKRRQWAREKAAKLPVKILFPLVLFIFPSILVVVLGPGASGIMSSLR